MSFIKKMFCKHDHTYTITNFSGDAINFFNCRSWRRCRDCGKIIEGGLDYWDKLDVRRYVNFEDFLAKNPGAKIYMATTKSRQTYTDVQYEDGCYIMFGKESAGIPEEILLDYKETSVRIPMFSDIRSLNLGNSVAIVLYEALRQQGFKELELEGQLHHYEW